MLSKEYRRVERARILDRIASHPCDGRRLEIEDLKARVDLAAAIPLL
jgi:hypothetical protein